MFAAFALEGRHVRLEPVTLKHVPGLVSAAAEDRSIYRYVSVPADAEAMTASVKTALGAPDQYPFAIVRNADDVVIGAARFMTIERWDGPWRDGLFPHAAEIGAVWFAASVLDTPCVLDAYAAMCREAFDEWNSQRVTVRVDADDTIGQTTMDALGASRDGVLRGQQHPFGRPGPRDLVCYSVLRSEWTGLAKKLAKRLG